MQEMTKGMRPRNPDEAIDLAMENDRLKSALRMFMKHATAEEGQAWGFDFIISEELYDTIQEWIK
jgi:hypothetical protein